LNEIEITKPPSFLYDMNGVSKRYYPDFYIESINLIIEVKSSYYYQLHKEKNELKKESIITNGFQYILILDKNYKNLYNLLFQL
jgi:very-short-patch-repair endonuclease